MFSSKTVNQLKKPSRYKSAYAAITVLMSICLLTGCEQGLPESGIVTFNCTSHTYEECTAQLQEICGKREGHLLDLGTANGKDTTGQCSHGSKE